jgi:hypothetical protein
VAVWQTGARFASDSSVAKLDATPRDIIGRIVDWIPGDVIILYAAAITALSADDNYKPSAWSLVIGGAGAFVWSLASSFATAGTITKLAAKAALFAGIATLLWAATVPGSGWQAFDWYADNTKFGLVVVAALAGLLGLVADGLVKRGWLPKRD